METKKVMKNKALLFINGDAPKTIPDLSGYALIACTDGAFHYLEKLHFPLGMLDFISGDFDSRQIENEIIRQAQYYSFEIIETPDQNKTDFHKALELIIAKGFKNIDVFGASGGEQDHFLGNLSVAFFFKDKINLKFFDEYSSYYFIPKEFSIDNVKGKMISLMPFPVAKNIETTGLKWPLHHEDLMLGERIGTRNVAENQDVSVRYSDGDLLVFIGK